MPPMFEDDTPPTWEGENPEADAKTTAIASRKYTYLFDYIREIGLNRALEAKYPSVPQFESIEDMEQFLTLQRKVQRYYPFTYAWQTDPDRGDYQLPTCEQLTERIAELQRYAASM